MYQSFWTIFSKTSRVWRGGGGALPPTGPPMHQPLPWRTSIPHRKKFLRALSYNLQAAAAKRYSGKYAKRLFRGAHWLQQKSICNSKRFDSWETNREAGAVCDIEIERISLASSGTSQMVELDRNKGWAPDDIPNLIFAGLSIAGSYKEFGIIYFGWQK